MSEAVTTKEDGPVVINMAKADDLWRSLDPLKQAELTNMMFEPVLIKAKEQADRIEELEAKLAKAVEALEGVDKFVRDLSPFADPSHSPATALARACEVYAELTGGKDE